MKKIEKIFFRKKDYGFFKGGIKIAILDYNKQGGNFCSYDACYKFWLTLAKTFTLKGFQ